MEELWELRRYVEAGDVDTALALLDEMEELSRDDKITRIRSYMKVLLTPLIKQAVEKRSSRSWDVSIRNALDEIATHNKRRKAGGWYLTRDELSRHCERRMSWLSIAPPWTRLGVPTRLRISGLCTTPQHCCRR
jgi:Domain of unknown function DUF29